MKLKPFSPKQMKALCWWGDKSPFRDRDGLICDGAVRSGKTLCMGMSFVLWAFARFSDRSFAFCGKTIRGVRRNLVTELLPVLRELGFQVGDRVSQNLLVLSKGKQVNRFYLFGGRDEASASLIQGVTLAGVLLDEAALMPRSFVEQALARCSVEGAKFWFNCNPEYPGHWFYREWIEKRKERNILYLHFTMDDNPSLSEEVKNRYRQMFSGAFYQRFVEGKWVAAQGLVYPFAGELLCDAPRGDWEDWAVSCDYGTVNPTSMGLWGLHHSCWYRVDEYYYDSRAAGEQRTDEEHYRALEKLCGERPVKRVAVDPSAASFIRVIQRRGRFEVIPAKNDVLDGIRRTGAALKEGRIRVCRNCVDTAREFSLYRWNNSLNRDAPVKENDHAMDDMRYFVTTLLPEEGEEGSAFCAVARKEEGERAWDF